MENGESKFRIMVVDDHPVMRKGYRFLLETEPDLRVCCEAGAALEAMQKVRDTEPDLVVVDISLGGMNGIALIKNLLAERPELLTLVVSTHDETMYGERALLAGARGYVMKSEVDETIVEAIRRILRGGFYLSEEMSTKILTQYQKMGGSAPREDATGVEQLSDRELEVFELIGQGMSTQEIADALLISPKTVESHRGRIKQKLSVDTTTALLQRATLWVERQP
jgi:DNA-binding NarL/FixJ family response regulator